MHTQIEILLFASLRERLEMQRLSLDWSEGSVSDLRKTLSARGDAWSDFMHPSRIRVAVNQVMAQEGMPVQPGDEVAFFPPVTGG